MLQGCYISPKDFLWHFSIRQVWKIG